MTHDELKLHAEVVTRTLLMNMFEGFHGSMTEMTEGLYAIAPDMFTGAFDAEYDDADAAICEWASNHMIAQNVYKQTAFGMIYMISDHVSRVTCNSTIGACIADGMMTHTNAEAALHVIADLLLCIEYDDATPIGGSDVFTYAFFEASL